MTQTSKYLTLIADDEQPTHDTSVFLNTKTQSHEKYFFVSL
jgi:hypothetical protein